MKNSMDRIIVINKEKGYTSRDIVNVVCKKLGTKKVGHTGTLDPIASGVLVLCVGKCLKLCEIIQGKDKEYVASFVMGINTDSLDITGNVLDKQEVIEIKKDEIIKVLNSFKGRSIQEVPLYSAVKVNGRKLYEYARSGIKVDLPKKEVTIKEIELLDYSDGVVKFRCVVSKGTYIRSLIRDIGIKLGVYTCMNDLIRTRQGDFKIEDSYTLDDIKKGSYKYYGICDIFPNVKKVIVSGDLLFKVKNGAFLDNIYNEDMVLFKDNTGNVLALYSLCEDKNKLKPWKMFL